MCRTHLTFWFSSFDSCVFLSAIVFLPRSLFFSFFSVLFCSFLFFSVLFFFFFFFSSFLSSFPLLLLLTHSFTHSKPCCCFFLSEYCVSRTLCSFSFLSFPFFFLLRNSVYIRSSNEVTFQRSGERSIYYSFFLFFLRMFFFSFFWLF
jgi:hypothetical protein